VLYHAVKCTDQCEIALGLLGEVSLAGRFDTIIHGCAFGKNAREPTPLNEKRWMSWDVSLLA